MGNSTFFFFNLRKLKRKYLLLSAILEELDFSDNKTVKKPESKHMRRDKMLEIF